MTSTRSRCTFLIALTAIFFCQTWMVYVDAAGRELPPLSAQATRGQELWLENNCQSCHQLFGFGGFLGPDLTNLARRLESHSAEGEATRTALDGRLETVLTTGSARMPAFHLAADERDDLACFFEELSRTGVGQIQVSEGLPPRELFAGLVTAAVASEAPGEPGEPEASGTSEAPEELGTDLIERGRLVAAERGCIDCHMPNAKSSFRATDLTRIHQTVEHERVTIVLTQGIPEKGMPSFALPEEDIQAVSAFLELLGRHGTDIRRGFETAERGSSGSLLDLPWFEYE